MTQSVQEQELDSAAGEAEVISNTEQPQPTLEQYLHAIRESTYFAIDKYLHLQLGNTLFAWRTDGRKHFLDFDQVHQGIVTALENDSELRIRFYVDLFDQWRSSRISTETYARIAEILLAIDPELSELAARFSEYLELHDATSDDMHDQILENAVVSFWQFSKLITVVEPELQLAHKSAVFSISFEDGNPVVGEKLTPFIGPKSPDTVEPDEFEARTVAWLIKVLGDANNQYPIWAQLERASEYSFKTYPQLGSSVVGACAREVGKRGAFRKIPTVALHRLLEQMASINTQSAVIAYHVLISSLEAASSAAENTVGARRNHMTELEHKKLQATEARDAMLQEELALFSEELSSAALDKVSPLDVGELLIHYIGFRTRYESVAKKLGVTGYERSGLNIQMKRLMQTAQPVAIHYLYDKQLERGQLTENLEALQFIGKSRQGDFSLERWFEQFCLKTSDDREVISFLEIYADGRSEVEITGFLRSMHSKRVISTRFLTELKRHRTFATAAEQLLVESWKDEHWEAIQQLSADLVTVLLAQPETTAQQSQVREYLNLLARHINDTLPTSMREQCVAEVKKVRGAFLALYRTGISISPHIAEIFYLLLEKLHLQQDLSTESQWALFKSMYQGSANREKLFYRLLGEKSIAVITDLAISNIISPREAMDGILRTIFPKEITDRVGLRTVVSTYLRLLLSHNFDQKDQEILELLSETTWFNYMLETDSELKNFYDQVASKHLS